jgi:hypothetical protein
MEVQTISRSLPLARALARRPLRGKLRRGAFFFAAALFAALPAARSGAWEEAAFLLNTEGNVEIRHPGGAWEKGVEGSALGGGALISTGFESAATLSIGQTLFTLSALSRLIIDEISVSIDEDGAVLEKVRLILDSGRLDALVQPPPSGVSDWLVKSRFAQMETRGAEFRFDTRTLIVWNGRAVFSGTAPSALLIDRGEIGELDAAGFAARRRRTRGFYGG